MGQASCISTEEDMTIRATGKYFYIIGELPKSCNRKIFLIYAMCVTNLCMRNKNVHYVIYFNLTARANLDDVIVH